MKRTIIGGLVAVAVAASIGLAAPDARAETYRDRDVPMTVAAALDIDRYMGRWFEIARFPNRFERGCEGVTADYALREDGRVSVLNSCREGSPEGPLKQADGVAEVVAPGRLKVSFVRWLPFARGDYWVLDIAPDYSVAVVGEPRGRTGWILARRRSISPEARSWAEDVLRRNGYDPAALREVRH